MTPTFLNMVSGAQVSGAVNTGVTFKPFLKMVTRHKFQDTVHTAERCLLPMSND